MTAEKTEVQERMVQEKAAAQAEMKTVKECSFGDDVDVGEKKRYHDIGSNANGVYVGWRDGFIGQGYVVAIFYWTGSVERSVTLEAAQDYANRLNSKNS